MALHQHRHPPAHPARDLHLVRRTTTTSAAGEMAAVRAQLQEIGATAKIIAVGAAELGDRAEPEATDHPWDDGLINHVVHG